MHICTGSRESSYLLIALLRVHGLLIHIKTSQLAALSLRLNIIWSTIRTKCFLLKLVLRKSIICIYLLLAKTENTTTTANNNNNYK